MIGASAGGIPPLVQIVSALTPEMAVSVLIVTHRAASRSDVDLLAALLNRGSTLQVQRGENGAKIERGIAYVAPPQVQMQVEGGRIRVHPQSHDRPHSRAIDALFRSAAEEYGARVIGVILSGMLDDGSAGCWSVRKHGGVTIVQAPAESRYASMPRSAMHAVPVHHCLPPAEIPPMLVELARTPPPRAPQHRARVLVVEDEKIVAMNLESRLRDLGYDVVGSIAHAEEVLDVAAATSPDVVLMDVHLAGEMRGTEAAALLWERLRTPIVFLTAYGDEHTFAEARRAMPVAYITKPYRSPDVHMALQLALDRRDSGQG